MTRRLAPILGFAVPLLLLASIGRASELSDDLIARRARLMQRLGPDTMLVLFSAPVQTYSHDVDYEYRQNSNLYYLTGMTQDETMLVLMPGNGSLRALLFIRDRDPIHEHWQGRLMSAAEAGAHTGIRTVLSNTQFESFLAAVLSRRALGPIDRQEAAAFFEALDAGRARVALALGTTSLNEPLTPGQDLARRIRDRFAGFQTIDALPMLADLRLIKTAYERTLLTRSLEISSEAQKAGMQATHPDVYEYEVEAAIEAVHRANGALSWSYPSIVGSGPNATILHYTENSRQARAGELMLVDAGCNYEYMAADITRTYPVSGTFSPAQRDIYDLVLLAQEEGMRVARPGARFTDIQARTVEVMKAGLLRLRLITDADSDQYRLWYTHSPNHFLGIDVHDVGERTRPLQPGMAFVIEPGLYIRPSALDTLPRSPENLALIERIRPAVEKYAHIGVRIEDAFLLEESGLLRLTASVPRTVEEIETFMRGRLALDSAP